VKPIRLKTEIWKEEEKGPENCLQGTLSFIDIGY
jgi:hypothetical protein